MSNPLPLFPPGSRIEFDPVYGFDPVPKDARARRIEPTGDIETGQVESGSTRKQDVENLGKQGPGLLELTRRRFGLGRRTPDWAYRLADALLDAGVVQEPGKNDRDKLARKISKGKDLPLDGEYRVAFVTADGEIHAPDGDRLVEAALGDVLERTKEEGGIPKEGVPILLRGMTSDAEVNEFLEETVLEHDRFQGEIDVSPGAVKRVLHGIRDAVSRGEIDELEPDKQRVQATVPMPDFLQGIAGRSGDARSENRSQMYDAIRKTDCVYHLVVPGEPELEQRMNEAFREGPYKVPLSVLRLAKYDYSARVEAGESLAVYGAAGAIGLGGELVADLVGHMLHLGHLGPVGTVIRGLLTGSVLFGVDGVENFFAELNALKEELQQNGLGEFNLVQPKGFLKAVFQEQYDDLSTKEMIHRLLTYKPGDDVDYEPTEALKKAAPLMQRAKNAAFSGAKVGAVVSFIGGIMLAAPALPMAARVTVGALISLTTSLGIFFNLRQTRWNQVTTLVDNLLSGSLEVPKDVMKKIENAKDSDEALKTLWHYVADMAETEESARSGTWAAILSLPTALLAGPILMLEMLGLPRAVTQSLFVGVAAISETLARGVLTIFRLKHGIHSAEKKIENLIVDAAENNGGRMSDEQVEKARMAFADRGVRWVFRAINFGNMDKEDLADILSQLLSQRRENGELELSAETRRIVQCLELSDRDPVPDGGEALAAG